jgi:DNA-directed RNA polymerase subunit RPC12/RpoP
MASLSEKLSALVGMWGDIVGRLRATSARGAQAVRSLQAQKRLWLLAVAGVVLVGAVAIGGYFALRSPPASRSAVQESKDWRFLFVCMKCGHRFRSAENISSTLPASKGHLRCPKCGEFEGNMYRRGSQAVPPGGW